MTFRAGARYRVAKLSCITLITEKPVNDGGEREQERLSIRGKRAETRPSEKERRNEGGRGERSSSRRQQQQQQLEASTLTRTQLSTLITVVCLPETHLTRTRYNHPSRG